MAEPEEQIRRGTGGAAPPAPEAEGSALLPTGHRAAERADVPRVLVIVAPCPFPVNHGTPGSIREIVQKQSARGHQVHVVTYPLHDDVPLDPRIHLHRVPMLGRSRRIQVGPTWRRPLWDALAVRTVARVVRRHRADVIHAYNYEGALIGWCARRLVRRAPLVFTTFNTMEDELPTYEFLPRHVAEPFSRLLDRWVPHLADRIVAISPELVDFLEARRIDPGRVDEIPMGIDPRDLEGGDPQRMRRRHRLGSAPLVVYTGLLNAFQRIDILIDAWARVVQQIPEARLMLVANYLEPEDEPRIRAHAQRLGIEESVVLTDERPFHEVRDYLAAADVCVVPRPDCPGVPIKMLNYLAAGRAVVTPEGSSKGLRNDEEALLARDGDPADLARQILRLLEAPALRERIADAGRQALLDRFSLDSICVALEGVYERLLDRGSR